MVTVGRKDGIDRHASSSTGRALRQGGLPDLTVYTATPPAAPSCASSPAAARSTRSTGHYVDNIVAFAHLLR